MRSICLSAVTAMLLFLLPVLSESASLEEKPSTKKAESTLPVGYEKLFGELADVMKKYPGAAERFHILDTKEKKDATPKSSFHACCEWECKSPGCSCMKQCLE